jgi:hypothetical protein
MPNACPSSKRVRAPKGHLAALLALAPSVGERGVPGSQLVELGMADTSWMQEHHVPSWDDAQALFKRL